jgi:ABC-type branched-subunit amino acid transport system substrate-binding protein
VERIRKTTGKKDLKTVMLLGTNAWSSAKGASGLPELIERGGKFVTCSVYVDGFFVDSERPATRRFVQAYRQANNGDPGLLEAYGFDTARMVRQILEKQAPKSRGDFREALANLKDFEGATGKTSFDEKREAQKPLFILAVDNKGINEVPPEKTARAGGS